MRGRKKREGELHWGESREQGAKQAWGNLGSVVEVFMHVMTDPHFNHFFHFLPPVGPRGSE